MSYYKSAPKNPIEKGETWIDEARNLVQCPYIPSHKLLPERFALHLTRCRKDILSNTSSPFHRAALSVHICKFDITHHISGGEEKMAEHLLVCSAANALRKPVKAVSLPDWKKTKARETIPKVEMENWNDDEEDSGGVYNPMNKLLATPNVILNPQGLTKSQRRAFRANQREYGSSSENPRKLEGFDSMY